MSAAALASRAAAPEDGLLGLTPARVFTPASLEEAAEVVRETAGDGTSLTFVGGGTELELGAPPSRLDAVLSTRRLGRVVECSPSDQIVCVEAGLTLAALQETLARNGQRLALDPPRADRATIGGLIATNAFGPRRARFGSVRDLLIGVTLVRADGAIAKGGGKVVKNVAGFDLPKLMVGSLGTLALVADATFRLHPLPEVETTVRIRGLGAADVARIAADVKAAQIEPTSLAAASRGGTLSFDLAVRFEGFRAGAFSQRDALLALGSVKPGAADVLDEPDSGALWADHDALRTRASLRVKVAALPSAFPSLAAPLLGPLLGALEDAAVVWYPTLGIAFLAGEVGDLTAAVRALEHARGELVRQRGSLVLQAAPAAVRALVDVWGPAPSAIALMRATKERLDPARRLSPGRFVGGI
ncbi:MAG TPA: FAD-binding oxidoreductase [Thermoanaerobaculia bacterium]|nr:FAD-binding oxidoreductase [Thermoanaerobaculia bacterium]